MLDIVYIVKINNDAKTAEALVGHANLVPSGETGLPAKYISQIAMAGGKSLSQSWEMTAVPRKTSAIADLHL